MTEKLLTGTLNHKSNKNDYEIGLRKQLRDIDIASFVHTSVHVNCTFMSYMVKAYIYMYLYSCINNLLTPGNQKIELTKRFLMSNEISLDMSHAMKKWIFAYAKTKTQISFTVTGKLISSFVFTTWIVQALFFLNPKFQAFRHFQRLYRPVCVRPGRNPQRPIRGFRVTRVL